MTKNKKLITLEICYDLISKIHSDLCNDIHLGRKSNITDDTLEILRKIILLSRRIKSEVIEESEGE